MKWYEKVLFVLTIICLLIAIVSGFFFYNEEKKKTSGITGQITDKYEVDNKCYILLEIETTPENYIGLDIGDEYEIN